ncbi:MAG: hypothetical protein JEZ08_14390 [Clostridiales bacterium]|nr:hypothetical protein [Clostridiales bacterium]
MSSLRTKKAVSTETFVFLILLVVGFGYVANIMTLPKMFEVIMATSHALLLDTVFFIMAIAVLAGAFSSLMSEFGVVALINKVISPVMKPVYGLPGAASIGAITTFLSDNPAIISLAKDKGFSKYFKNYQTPALCNLGTAFGMGLILTVFMSTQGDNFGVPAAMGVLGAVIGSIVSVRIMLHFTKKYYGVSKEDIKAMDSEEDFGHVREIRDGNALERALEAMLEGGKNGVDLGLSIIPGVLIICTIVMLLTFGPAGSENGVAFYKGVAFEGVELLPKLGVYIQPILKPLFGFTSAEAIAFPITSLGAVGAAMSLVPKFLAEGLIGANEIAVFTAMGMCWSGYLSTHVGMMDALNVRQLVNKAILSHTIGGLVAGISAHYLYVLVSQFI